MGWHNVTAAAQATGISTAARLVLITMAHVSLDDEAQHQGVPLLYWGGWPLLAMWLGYGKYDDTAKERVRRCVRELVTAGYVEPLHHHPSGNRVYRLHLSTDTRGHPPVPT